MALIRDRVLVGFKKKFCKVDGSLTVISGAAVDVYGSGFEADDSAGFHVAAAEVAQSREDIVALRLEDVSVAVRRTGDEG